MWVRKKGDGRQLGRFRLLRSLAVPAPLEHGGDGKERDVEVR